MDGTHTPSWTDSGHPDPDILGLTADSRAVRPGYLFAALSGSKTDGNRFIEDALARGAHAVLTDDEAAASALARRSPPVPVIVDANPRRRLALMAARFHAPAPRTIAAVTGTNGKTSVAAFTRQIWQALGTPAASVGTLGIVGPDFTIDGALTTPDPVTLHRDLKDLAARGIDHVALEASSHGLDQFRLDGLTIAAAAFTNLTHDHLDYHGTMAAYLQAKARLFDVVMAPGGVAVLNADIPQFSGLASIAHARGHRLFSYGEARTADLRLVDRRDTAAGQELRLQVLGFEAIATLPVTGAFQAMNVLAALGLVIGCGTDVGSALATLPRLTGVPGRLERVATHPSGAPIYVDYAHKPLALETILKELKPTARRRLVVVFGCGGDRDRAKRPMMGEIAQRLADRVIVTDDNPRFEEPAAIRAAILATAPGAREIGDRRLAIETAIGELADGDVLVIAGKGHEQGQSIAGVIHPFDDRQVARACIARLADGAGAK